MSDLSQKRLLFVLTSVSQFPDSGRLTGFYMDEMAIPYWTLRDAGARIDFASIKGGEAPIDPNSLGEDGNRVEEVQRFLDDSETMVAMNGASAVEDVDATQYDGVFLPGGHGTMWDFAQSKPLADLIGTCFDRGAVIGAVCHGPAGLVSAKQADGRPVVDGKTVNSFTNAEENAVGLTDVVPYLLETELRNKGAIFEATLETFNPYAVRDGNLVTGQNPASARPVADLMLEAFAAAHGQDAA